MIKHFFVFFTTLLFSTTGVAAVCVLGIPALPFNTTFAGGPTMVNIVMAEPLIGTALYAARDEWDATDAAGHIGDWNGVTTSSDCPAGQPMQIGAFGFANSNCATNIAYNIPSNAKAYVDAYPRTCPQCGTRSLAINLNFAWSLNPLPGQHDIETVFAHEFGHMLGLSHQWSGVCNNFPSPLCTTSPNTETMGINTYSGETCQRTIENNDIQSADWLY